MVDLRGIYTLNKGCDHMMNSWAEKLHQKDFEKVKEYLEENGKTPAFIISEDTGVSVDIINEFLRNGRIEIPEGELSYIQCEKCGQSIRYGRFCPHCALSLSKDIQSALNSGMIGEIPKTKTSSRMHYFELKKLQEKRNKLK